MTAKLKNTPDDVLVLDRLWGATEREIRHFAERFVAEAVKGEAYSEAQRDVAWAAKAKGYPIYIIRQASHLYAKNGKPERALERLTAYRSKIGLSA